MPERLLPSDSLGGAWRRAGLAWGGDSLFVERADALWLQVGDFFADLRVPYEPADPEATVLDTAQAFSGQVRYDPPRVTWSHDLDTMARPAGHRDSAVVERHGSMLFERGKGYMERWQRERAPEQVAVMQRDDPGSGYALARIVVVADLALGVWVDPVPGGVALVRRQGEWSIVATVGPTGPSDPGGGAGPSAPGGVNGPPFPIIVEVLQAGTGRYLDANQTLPAGWRQMATT
jgi:hypothetical protein